jgi:hypothetical protein
MNSQNRCFLVFGALVLVMATGAVAAGEGCGKDETADACCAAPDVCKDKSELDQCEVLHGEGLGYCVRSPHSTWMECVPGCIKLELQCDYGCCYSAGKKNEFPCGPAGTKLPGEECFSVNDCVCGTVCLERNGGAFCWVVCTDDDECDTGTCTETDLGFSVCEDEEPE